MTGLVGDVAGLPYIHKIRTPGVGESPRPRPRAIGIVIRRQQQRWEVQLVHAAPA